MTQGGLQLSDKDMAELQAELNSAEEATDPNGQPRLSHRVTITNPFEEGFETTAKEFRRSRSSEALIFHAKYKARKSRSLTVTDPFAEIQARVEAIAQEVRRSRTEALDFHAKFKARKGQMSQGRLQKLLSDEDVA